VIDGQGAGCDSSLGLTAKCGPKCHPVRPAAEALGGEPPRRAWNGRPHHRHAGAVSIDLFIPAPCTTADVVPAPAVRQPPRYATGLRRRASQRVQHFASNKRRTHYRTGAMSALKRTPLSLLLDFAWRTAFRLGFPLPSSGGDWRVRAMREPWWRSTWVQHSC
jgi:hypothetical protein